MGQEEIFYIIVQYRGLLVFKLRMLGAPLVLMAQKPARISRCTPTAVD